MPAAVFAAAPSKPVERPEAGSAKPNIIFVLTDDLGYGDVGAFYQQQQKAAGRPAHFTPNLDTMAAGGMRLTDHYCPAPVCAPSRASLLLGVNQGHANVRDNQFDKELENNHTLGTVMKSAGYRTVAIGKWGLQGNAKGEEGDEQGNAGESSPGREVFALAQAKPKAEKGDAKGGKGKAGEPAKKKGKTFKSLSPEEAKAQIADWPAYPLKRGFDEYFGYIRHGDGHEHYPKEGAYNGLKQVWDNDKEISATLDKCYTADLFAAKAKKWIVDHEAAKAAEPFFMYLAFDTPHAVLQLPTQAYPTGGGLKGGLQWIGKPGHMINTASGTVDGYTHPDYAKATYDDDHNPATPPKPWPDVYKRYATDVRRIDDCVGDLFQLLKDLKIDQNTMVVFSSDNGPSVESYLKEPYSPQFFSSYGPFDGIKRDCWEGGMRVPTIAYWPGHIAGGQVSHLPSSFPDWMPTFAAVAGVPAPARSTGTSLLPTLTGQGTQATPHVYVEYWVNGKTPDFPEFESAHRGRARQQMQALRIGDYVGVRYNIAKPTDDFEIYDVVKDPKEAHDLGKQTDFADLQKQFKELSVASRRPGGGVKRPYDGESMGAVAKPATAAAGLAWKSFDANLTYAAQFDGMTSQASGVAAMPDLAGKPAAARGVFYQGMIEVPADGEYTFTLTASGGALMRLHEAVIVDGDFGHTPGQPASGKVLLKKGLHPMRMYFAQQGSTTPQLKLEWEGPGVSKQVVPATALSHG